MCSRFDVYQQAHDAKLFFTINQNDSCVDVTFADHRQLAHHLGFLFCKGGLARRCILEVVCKDLLRIQLAITASVLHDGIKGTFFIDVQEDLPYASELVAVVVDRRLFDTAIALDCKLRHGIIQFSSMQTR